MKKFINNLISFFKNFFKNKVVGLPKLSEVEQLEALQLESKMVEDKITRAKQQRSRDIIRYHLNIGDGKLFSSALVKELSASSKTYNYAKIRDSEFTQRLRDRGLLDNQDLFDAITENEKVKDKTLLIRQNMGLKYKNK